ncbi:hypothetical protein [Cryptosporangium phraense]|uniref:Uncharacterized protein n=1 Tax=Cryptosporangium phraense TaxID=2593070 RepID=A0A545AP77_9ACTN|nr:hypothetical protein [Cryptosporangium phraense]TQS43061.1 hypothetical protein FL583_21755 [Cryptosporangium phraense]
MTSTIPPEREVSPERRAAIHADLRRRIATHRRRPGPRARRHLLPLVAAAAVLVVLGTTVTVLTLIRDHRGPEPASHRPHPAPAPYDLPGFTAAGRLALRNACVTALKNEKPGQGMSPTRMAKQFVDLDDLQLLNAVTDARTQTIAVLTDGEKLTYCIWRSVAGRSSLPPAAQVDVLGYGEHVQWLPGPVMIDLVLTSGGPPFTTLVIGRATPDVRNVAVTAGEKSYLYGVRQGTFIASVTHQKPPTRPASVRGYPLHGKLTAPFVADGDTCAVDPDGTVVVGSTTDPSTCRPAVPWR